MRLGDQQEPLHLFGLKTSPKRTQQIHGFPGQQALHRMPWRHKHTETPCAQPRREKHLAQWTAKICQQKTTGARQVERLELHTPERRFGMRLAKDGSGMFAHRNIGLWVMKICTPITVTGS
ncbi:MAG: hypothetical protein BWY63_03447 [Chloroflexi bacterium ADurb.Bin360]|nr:MAG: hypothetical protein BWY63_03447 [Chloroflexi bacterium ADurb.Bin360]